MLCHIQNTVSGTRQGTARRRSLAGMGETKILTTHFQEHVFPDIPCMTCRKRQGTEHSKTAELGMDGLEGMSGTVRPGNASLLLSKQSKKYFWAFLLKHKQRRIHLNGLKSTNKGTHGPLSVICCLASGQPICTCKCLDMRGIKKVYKYNYEPIRWLSHQERITAVVRLMNRG